MLSSARTRIRNPQFCFAIPPPSGDAADFLANHALGCNGAARQQSDSWRSRGRRDRTGADGERPITFRALEIPPDIKDAKKHIEILQDINKKVKQKYPPTKRDLKRHPSMHRTDTVDMFIVAYGEIYLVSDTDETLLKPGDTAVVQGVNHAWSNRSDSPCMIIGVMVHANPWPKDLYPAEGL